MAKDLKITVKAVSANGSANTKGVVGTVRQANVTAGARQAAVTGVVDENRVVGKISEAAVFARPSDPTVVGTATDLKLTIQVDPNLLADRPSVSPRLFQYIEDSIGHYDSIHLAKQRVASNLSKLMDDTVLKIGKRFLETVAKHDDFRASFQKKLRSDSLTFNDSQSVRFSKPKTDFTLVQDVRKKFVSKRKTDNIRLEQIFRKLLTKSFSERLGHSDDILGASVVGDDIRVLVRKNKTDTHAAKDAFGRVVAFKRKPTETRVIVEEIRADFHKSKVDAVKIVDFIKLSKVYNRYLNDSARAQDKLAWAGSKVKKDYAVAHDYAKIVVSWKRKPSDQTRFLTDIRFNASKLVKNLSGAWDSPSFVTNKKRTDTVGAKDSFKRAVQYKRIKLDYYSRTDDVHFLASKGAKDFNSSLCKLKFATYKLLKNQACLVTWVSKGTTKKLTMITGIRDSVILLKTPVRRFNEQRQWLDTVTAFKQNYTTSSYFAGDYVGTNYILE